MIKRIVIILISLVIVACHDDEKSLTVVSLGGVHTKSQQVAFYKPFEQQHQKHIISDVYGGEMAKIRAMIETNQVNWDIVQVETPKLIQGCSEGLFEPLNISKTLNKKEFVEGVFSECGVGFFTWSIVLAYDTQKIKLMNGENPWKAFWDVKKFPGKRGLQKTPMIALEIALLADGVKADNLYNVLSTDAGVNRAFKKLDELKPNIVWWEKGSQPIPLLISGDLTMTTTFSGRAVIAKKERRSIDVVWSGSFYDMDNFAIIKNSPHKKAALEFIQFALQAKQQKHFSEYSNYGFVNKGTLDIIDPAVLEGLSNDPNYMMNANHINANFWVEHGESLQQRFNVWASRE